MDSVFDLASRVIVRLQCIAKDLCFYHTAKDCMDVETNQAFLQVLICAFLLAHLSTKCSW